MEKVTGQLIDMEDIDETYCRLVFDLDEISAEDEITEVKITKRIIAEFLGLDMAKFEDLLKNPETRKILKNSPREMQIMTKCGFNRILKI